MHTLGSLVCVLLCSFVINVHSYDYNYCGAPAKLSVTKTNYTLEFVQMITRHGDRTTITQLPGDHHVWQCNMTTLMAPVQSSLPTVNIERLYRKNYLPGREPTPGNCYLGELTTRGFNQHVTLGQNLRQLYVDTYKFLPPTIDPTIMWIRSTDIPRTIASAQGNSLGLYPPSSGSSSEIPVFDFFTMDISNENMFANGLTCPRVTQLLHQINTEPDYVNYMKSKVPLQQNLSEILGIPLNSLPDWSGLLDALEVMTCYNQSYPGLDTNTIDEVFEVANWQWNYQLANYELALLQLGSFVVELVNNIQSFMKGVSMPKYLVFSGHDTTIGPILATLQAYDGQWPPYASHIEMELWNNEGDYFVQVKYQGEPLKLSNCSATLCPISQFMTQVAPIMNLNYQQACVAQ